MPDNLSQISNGRFAPLHVKRQGMTAGGFFEHILEVGLDVHQSVKLERCAWNLRIRQVGAEGQEHRSSWHNAHRGYGIEEGPDGHLSDQPYQANDDHESEKFGEDRPKDPQGFPDQASNISHNRA